MEYKLYHKAPYDDIERYGGLMEVSSPCSRFERRYDFDAFFYGGLSVLRKLQALGQ